MTLTKNGVITQKKGHDQPSVKGQKETPGMCFLLFAEKLRQMEAILGAGLLTAKRACLKSLDGARPNLTWQIVTISLPEFMTFKLFGKTILVVNIKFGLF